MFKKVFEESKGNGTNKIANTQWSFEQVDNINYVRAEKNIFTKEDGTLMSEKEIFDSLDGKTLHLPDGDIKIVKSLPKKNMYSELYRRRPIGKKLVDIEDVNQLNYDVNHNLEELLINTSIKNANVPDVGNKHSEQGIVDFDTRTVKFYDGEKAYDIEFSIANLQNGEKVAYAKKFFGYDDILTKKIQKAEAMSGGVNSAPSQMNQQSVSANSISPTEKNATEFSNNSQPSNTNDTESTNLFLANSDFLSPKTKNDITGKEFKVQEDISPAVNVNEDVDINSGNQISGEISKKIMRKIYFCF